MTASLPTVYGEFWRSEEKRLSVEMQQTTPGSVEHMAANVFRLAATHQLRLLQELTAARAMEPWPFYQFRARYITQQFDSRLKP